MKRLVALALAASVVSGCYSLSTRYKFALDSVQRSPSRLSFAGELRQAGKSNSSDSFFCEDDAVMIYCIPSQAGMTLSVANKLDHSIKVLWDDSAFVNHRGQSMRVIHEGVRLMDKEKAQVPSIVPMHSTFSDSFGPADSYDYVSFGNNGHWEHEDLFPSFPDDNYVMQEKLSTWKGKPFQTLIAIEINGTKVEYQFGYHIADAMFVRE